MWNIVPSLGVQRLIKHCEPLKAYFIDHDENSKVKQIRKVLCDPKTLPLLHFMEEVLKPVDSYNRLFQKEEFILDKAYEATLSLLTDMLGRILPPAVIRKHIRSDPRQIDMSKLLNDEDVDFGTPCRVVLGHMEDSELPEIQIQVNLNFEEDFYFNKICQEKKCKIQ